MAPPPPHLAPPTIRRAGRACPPNIHLKCNLCPLVKLFDVEDLLAHALLHLKQSSHPGLTSDRFLVFVNWPGREPIF